MRATEALAAQVAWATQGRKGKQARTAALAVLVVPVALPTTAWPDRAVLAGSAGPAALVERARMRRTRPLPVAQVALAARAETAAPVARGVWPWAWGPMALMVQAARAATQAVVAMVGQVRMAHQHVSMAAMAVRVAAVVRRVWAGSREGRPEQSVQMAGTAMAETAARGAMVATALSRGRTAAPAATAGLVVSRLSPGLLATAAMVVSVAMASMVRTGCRVPIP